MGPSSTRTSKVRTNHGSWAKKKNIAQAPPHGDVGATKELYKGRRVLFTFCSAVCRATRLGLGTADIGDIASALCVFVYEDAANPGKVVTISATPNRPEGGEARPRSKRI